MQSEKENSPSLVILMASPSWPALLSTLIWSCKYFSKAAVSRIPSEDGPLQSIKNLFPAFELFGADVFLIAAILLVGEGGLAYNWVAKLMVVVKM
jgi:hypothetical protein